MITKETIRYAASQQLPREEAYKLISLVGRTETPAELALLWDRHNLRPKIDLEYYVKPKTFQSNTGP